MDEKKPDNKPAVRKRAGPKAGRPVGATAWTFPKNTLEQAIEIAKAIRPKKIDEKES
jgi:hypothetical protein